MGIRNRQRRAAKAKRRAAQEQARRHGGDRPGGERHVGDRHARDRRDGDIRDGVGDWSGGRSRERSDGRPQDRLFTSADEVRRVIELAAAASGQGDERFVADAVDWLADADGRLVGRESERALLGVVGLLWNHGWQPAELVRHARRVDGRAGRVVATAVAADHARRDPQTLHPRWVTQVAAMGLPDVDAPTGWLADIGGREWIDRRATIAGVVVALRILRDVSPLTVLIPPPGAGTGAAIDEPGSTIDDPVLVKVRALLAQAESTTFEAEAETFTAKAQELMARHAIDAAMLWARTARDERPTTIRLPIDEPYVDIKSLLLQCVADHSRCKAVRHPPYALSSVVGFASDVAATELLFTSLLVQSQAAMQAEAARAGPGSSARSRSFRSSFLMAYTHRIDARLAEINVAVETAAASDHEGALLPVLAARDGAVDDTIAEMFGDLRSSIVRGGSDAAGWARGTLAADRAKLNAGDLGDTDADRTTENHEARMISG